MSSSKSVSGNLYEIDKSELPLSCPRTAQWDAHPRVSLPFPKGITEVSCPYCGARYRLKTSNAKDKG